MSKNEILRVVVVLDPPPPLHHHSPAGVAGD
jgi:hypothetical protein